MYQVLLVDDEPIILSGIKFLIDWEACGCQIADTARNGQQALEKLRALRPDIVICDIAMPVLSGTELLAQAAEESPSTVFIMLTNHPDFQLARESLRYKAVDYLLKSQLDGPTLEKSLARACAERDKRAKLARATLAEDVREEKRRSMLEDAFFRVVQAQPGVISAPAAAVLADSGVLSGYAVAYIPVDFSGLAGYEDFSEDERRRLFSWEKEVCDKLAQSLFPHYALLSADEDCLFVLCWGLAEGEWEEKAPLLAEKLTAASATITQARPYVLATDRFAGADQLDRCRQQVFALRDHFYLSCEGGKLFRDLPHVPWAPLALSGLADRLSTELRAKNAAGCRAALDRAIERIRTVPHQKSQAIWLCGEIYGAVCGVLEDSDGAARVAIERLATREQVLRWLETLKNELTEQLGTANSGKSELIEKVKQYVRDNVDKRIMLQDAADYACISPGYLSALFKKLYNQNFVDYINQVKTERACEMIREGKYRIYEISYQLGFENAYYFTRVFKRHMGLTPTEYQKKLRGGAQG